MWQKVRPSKFESSATGRQYPIRQKLVVSGFYGQSSHSFESVAAVLSDFINPL